MAAVIDICNMALGHLGRSTQPIQSLTEKSIEARSCNLWYAQSVQELLVLQDWTFARRRQTLALSPDAVPCEWVYRYKLPSDTLKFLRIWNPLTNIPATAPSTVFGGFSYLNAYWGDLTNAIPYELEQDLEAASTTLLTNQPAAVGVYTQNLINSSQFTPLFVNALAHYLAAKLAYPLTGKQSAEDKEAKAFSAALRAATAADAQQGVAEPIRDGFSVRARL